MTSLASADCFACIRPRSARDDGLTRVVGQGAGQEVVRENCDVETTGEQRERKSVRDGPEGSTERGTAEGMSKR